MDEWMDKISLVLSFYVPYFSVLGRYLMFSGIFSVKSYILVVYWYFVGVCYVTFAYEPNSWDVILLVEATVYYAFGLTFVEVLVVVLHAFFFSTSSVLSLNACVGVI